MKNYELFINDVREYCKKNNMENFKFHVTVNDDLNYIYIDNLDLSTRSLNALKRSHINTIGELVNSISSSQDLKRIKNMGVKSCSEIMSKLLYFQYCSLSKEAQDTFIEKYIV